ncbi:hypothetical protein PpBr36_08873 [Pyricularia pennisetigena]|uniref:hypothetical protein n=1 Tax=Pyricularia pennisetigena TaxID=1578925 RepID=UPI00115479F6|nr:hypothetical protein PpBr36_08873 [Pyricularia pennisetigena]TLS24831.1 hypothetical protein PpBr36_08873 [Pyricularia pennisetigena]
MRASFLAVAVAAVAVQAAPAVETRDAVAAIPAACTPTPGLDTAATYDKFFAFQKTYLFDKNVAETFKYFAADFQSKQRFSSLNRDQYWASSVVQDWNTTPSYPTDSTFKDGTAHVAYDLGEKRTGHAGDDFVWKDGCIVSHQQTRS